MVCIMTNVLAHVSIFMTLSYLLYLIWSFLLSSSRQCLKHPLDEAPSFSTVLCMRCYAVSLTRLTSEMAAIGSDMSGSDAGV